MTIGELEYDTVLTDNVKTNATSGLPNIPMEGVTYTLYAIFLLLMPIILMNLLVSLLEFELCSQLYSAGNVNPITQTAMKIQQLFL